MDLNYTAVWKTTEPLNGMKRVRITHGTITEEDLAEVIKMRADCDDDGVAYISGADCEFSDFSIDSVSM